MKGIRTDCKYCKKDIKLVPGESEKAQELDYYCTISKMVNNSCPEDCEWYTPTKTYVV